MVVAVVSSPNIMAKIVDVLEVRKVHVGTVDLVFDYNTDVVDMGNIMGPNIRKADIVIVLGVSIEED